MLLQLIGREVSGELRLGVRGCVTDEAERDQIVFVVAPAIRLLDDVVNLEVKGPETSAHAAAAAAPGEDPVCQILLNGHGSQCNSGTRTGLDVFG